MRAGCYADWFYVPTGVDLVKSFAHLDSALKLSAVLLVLEIELRR